MGVPADELLARLEAAEARLEVAERAAWSAREECRRWARRFRAACALGAAVAVAALVGGPTTRAVAQGYGSTLQQLLSRVTALESSDQAQGNRLNSLEDKTKYLSVDGTDVKLTGANLHILNGTGGTETANGLGNLIVGYNEVRGAGNLRTGSHNIVTGILNNYSSFGGIVGGYSNSLGGGEQFCVGTFNGVTGSQSTVTGGYGNQTTQDYASVTGGAFNTAAGIASSVSGGAQNTAGGTGPPGQPMASSVSGGFANAAEAQYASVSGGQRNAANEITSSVSGGAARHTASGVTAGWAAGSQASGGFTAGNFSSP